ncbi:MAG: molecular chaperone Hsp90 [Clostridia bacterium]|nr:molecular chaperone Hsp90 [Clostridia bacterium]MBQ6000749.1 molecular chaperone Hsp90 [Clostridia bacterium]
MLEKNIVEAAKLQVKALLEAPSACAEVKAAAESWLAAIGTAAEAEETAKFIAELKEDIVPIDGLVAFAESDAAAKVFGDKAAAFAAHARELKASGAEFCDCAACTACAALLDLLK